MYNLFEDYDNPVPGEGPFYTDYLYLAKEVRDVGLEFIDWESTKYDKLYEHYDDIITYFNSIYRYRELGAETETRFQDILQQRYYEIADRYNHAFKVMEENDIDQLGTGYSYKELRHRTIDTEGTSSGTESRDNKYKDTPASSTSTLNNPTEQTLDDRENSSTAETQETLDDEITRDNTKHDDPLVVELNYLIDRYKQLEIEFVMSFEQCFIGLLQ